MDTGNCFPHALWHHTLTLCGACDEDVVWGLHRGLLRCSNTERAFHSQGGWAMGSHRSLRLRLLMQHCAVHMSQIEEICVSWKNRRTFSHHEWFGLDHCGIFLSFHVA